MTEDEAKTKTCCGPQTIAMMIGIAAPNLRAELMPNAGNCIGSACMAWRWNKIANPDWKPHDSMVAVYPQPNPYAGVPAHVDSKTDGRCGLAGTP